MRALLSLAPLALAAGFAFPAYAQDVPPQGTISIQGHGEVQAAPDTAFITSGVTSQADTARNALDANTKDMAALLEALKGAGIAEKDIQTSGFSVNPNYVYSDARDANGFTLPPKISGYVVSNSVTVRVRDITTLGAVLDRAVTVGSNTINGITFTVADPSKLYDDARKAAFLDAKAKAGLYAEVADVGLAQILSISEGTPGTVPQPMMMMKAAAPMADSAVPVQAGELTYSIDVSVQWQLDQTAAE